MLTDYREIRDRIFELCRENGLRPDFPETTRMGRVLLVWSKHQRVVARTFIPTRANAGPVVLGRLRDDLSGIFGEGWLD